MIFTYYFPPAGGVAVQRFLKFSKFLPEFGWEPIIITVENGSYPYYDESLLREISPALRMYRTKTFEPFEFYNLLKGKKGKVMPLVAVGANGNKSFFQRAAEFVRANFFIPDARKGWVPYAIKQAEEIIENEKIAAIITTGPPHSTHLIGLKLKEKYGIKWVADFRDPWTKIFYNKLLPRTSGTETKDKRMEEQVLSSADLVTVISPGLKAEFENEADNIRIIHNGYDGDDFNEPLATKSQSRFILRYIGNLMSSQNPVKLWKVISELIQEGNNITLECIGRVDIPIRQSIAEAGIEAHCIFKDFTDHRSAIALMQTSNMLLFIIPDVPDNGLIVTGKLFEYLASGTELISIGPVNGDAATILKQSGRKPMIDFSDADSMKEQLLEGINRFNNNQQVTYPLALHQNFERKRLTGLLALELDRLTEKV